MISFVLAMTPGGALFAEEPASKRNDAEARHAEAPVVSAHSKLTLDPELARAADKLLELARPVEGAVVVVEVKTGRILVWSERRRGAQSGHSSAGARETEAPGSVITTAKAPAASVFKLVTSAALLETAGVLPSDRVCISGGMRRIEREHLEAPRGNGVQCDAFSQALGHSRNAVFAQLATTRLARTDLLQIAERLGFNGDVPFDWPVPVGHLQVPYNDLEFARTAAGFRGSTLSPLGGAYLASIVAEGGLSRRFHLNEPNDPSADARDETPTRLLSASTAARLARMMEVTTHSGTCRQIFNDEHGHAYLPSVRVAGKTGTLRPYSREETASWFIGFAPSRDPEIVVSVMLENGHIWRRKAAEVARDLLRFYFHRQGAADVSNPLAEPPHATPPDWFVGARRTAPALADGRAPIARSH